MKKIFLLLVLCLIGVAIFVNHTFNRIFDNNRELSISVKENDRRYELRAEYPKRKTYLVQHLMDERLHTNNVFSNSRINADITVDNNISLHVRTRPGYLMLRMDKDKNDSNGYTRLKDLERELKDRLDDGRNN